MGKAEGDTETPAVRLDGPPSSSSSVAPFTAVDEGSFTAVADGGSPSLGEDSSAHAMDARRRVFSPPPTTSDGAFSAFVAYVNDGLVHISGRHRLDSPTNASSQGLVAVGE